MIETIYPTLATYGTFPTGALYGKTFSLGTPRGTRLGSLAGRNHSRALSSLEEDKFVKGVEYTVYDNPLVDEVTIEALKNKMSKSKFDREFMVKFEASSTTIFSNFDVQTHTINVREVESLKNRDDLYLIVAFDFGQVS